MTGNPSAVQQWIEDLREARQRVTSLSRTRQGGRLTRATGLVLEAVGLQLPLGAHCIVEIRGGNDFAEAEVVGFNQEKLLLMPFVDTAEMVPGARVCPSLSELK